MSSIIFGGASQVVFAQLWSYGTSPIITGGSVAIINMRHIIYSANVSFYISSLPLRWRIVLGYLLTDEAFAVSFQEFENKNRFAHYHLLGGGLTLWVFWQISTVVELSFTSIPELASEVLTLPTVVVLLRRSLLLASFNTSALVLLKVPLPLMVSVY